MNNSEARERLRANKVDICSDPRDPITILEDMGRRGLLLFGVEASSVTPTGALIDVASSLVVSEEVSAQEEVIA